MGTIIKKVLLVLIAITMIGMTANAQHDHNPDWLSPDDSRITYIGSHSPVFDIDGLPAYRYHNYYNGYYYSNWYYNAWYPTYRYYVPYNYYYHYPNYGWYGTSYWHGSGLYSGIYLS